MNIRLIATDMDGTLLDDKKQLPPHFSAMLAQLQAKDISFVIGSGRTFAALQPYFSSMDQKMDFICANGAYVMAGGSAPVAEILPRALVQRIVACVQGLGAGVRAVLCGMRGIYAQEYRQDPVLLRCMGSSFASFLPCADLSAVQDDIFEVAVCDPNGAAAHTLPALQKHFGNVLQVVQSGPLYVDIVNPAVSKGAALARLQAVRGILPQETMVFGDYTNDIEMLACGAYSFIMENAAPAMYPHGRYRAPSNNEHGVVQIIQNHVLEGKPLPAPV